MLIDKRIERRLFELRSEWLKAEMLARAVCRISSDPDCPVEVLQYKLMEIEVIAEILIDLIDRTSGEMEPHFLQRNAEKRLADEQSEGPDDE